MNADVCLPDVLQHVQNLRRQVGALHIKLSEVRLQQGRGRLLWLEGGRIFPNPQDSVANKLLPSTNQLHQQTSCGLQTLLLFIRHLRAMLRTLVLLRMRCGCFEEEGEEEEAGMEESVWTFKTQKS